MQRTASRPTRTSRCFGLSTAPPVLPPTCRHRSPKKAYRLLTDRGLIRVGLPMLSTMQFKITGVQDPYSCNTNPATGLSDQKTGIASFYRRPLPSTNLGFLSAIMWDGREPDLFHQSVDAT